MMGAPTNSANVNCQPKNTSMIKGKLDDQIGGGHFKRHGGGEIGTLPEQRARDRYGCIRARRGRCAECQRLGNGGRPIVRQQPGHFLMGNHRLHHARQLKPRINGHKICHPMANAMPSARRIC